MLNIKFYIRIDQFFNSCTHQLLAQNQISDLYDCCNHSLLAHIHMPITDQPYREITSRAREWKFGDLTTKKWCLMLDTWWPTLARSEKRRISLEKRRICSFSLEKRRISNLSLLYISCYVAILCKNASRELKAWASLMNIISFIHDILPFSNMKAIGWCKCDTIHRKLLGTLFLPM